MRRIFACWLLPFLFVAVVHNANAQTSSQFLVASYLEDGTPGFSLHRVNSDGTEEEFTSGRFTQVNISPDGRHVATIAAINRNLEIYGATGNLLYTYNLQLGTSSDESPMRLWGWLDQERIGLFSTGDVFSLFELFPCEASAEPVLVSTAPWNFEQVEPWLSYGLSPYQVLILSPDFEHLLAPGSVCPTSDLSCETELNESFSLWSFNPEPAALLRGVESIFPWWHVPLSAPVWSHSGQQVILPHFDEGEPHLNLLSVDDPTLRILAPVPCAGESYCLPERFTWNAEDTQVVYWLTLGVETRERNLWWVDVQTGEQRPLLTSTRPDILDTAELFWSPDGQAVAFSYTQEDQLIIRTLDVNANTLDEHSLQIVPQSTQTYLVGWLAN